MKPSPPNRIAIDRWNVTHFVPAGDTPARDLCERLERLLQSEVAAACADQIRQFADSGDPSIWLIRRLDVNLSLAARPESSTAAAALLGRQLAATISKRIDAGDEDGEVIHFPDRAAYLAQFVSDLSAGRAWGKWYYVEFESLRALGLSRAIREALTADPDWTAPAISALTEIRGLRAALSALSPADARAVFDACGGAADSAGSGQDSWIGQLLEYWSETPLRTADSNPFRDGLWWLALAWARHRDAAYDQNLLDAVDSLLRLRRVLAALSPGDRAALTRFLASDDIASAAAFALRRGVDDPVASLEFFARQMRGDLHWAAQAEGVLLGETEFLHRAANTASAPRGMVIASEFAGIFRLGPSFSASGCHHLLATFPEPHSALLRHLVALKCLGGVRAAAAADDRAVRLFSGFAQPSLEDALAELPSSLQLPEHDAAVPHEAYYRLADVLPGISPELDQALTPLAAGVLQHFCRRLIGFANSSPGHIYDNLLAGTGLVCDTGDRLEVELHSPNLAIVLRLAGLLEETYHLPWLKGMTEGKEVCLRPLAE